jgi:selenide,water dikinase
VFGAGDIAVQVNHPRPKAGVYAVRQAPVLAANLRAASQGGPLREHHPQTRFLSLLSLGPQVAAAERSVFSAHGRWVWHWKNHIDRKFMGLFLDLPARRMGAAVAAVPEDTQAPCGGCGAKVGGVELRAALVKLRERYPQLDPQLGLDDTAVIDAGQALLQSTDQLRALIDDPWLMGRIAAQHALSDAYASGARPHSALAQLSLPFADEKLQQRDLAAVLDGALLTLSAAECPLVGGHTMQGPELQLGFTINAVLDGQQAMSKRGARVGDALILGKALGVGALFAAHMQQRADGRDIDAALRTMLQSNAEAAAIARRFDAHALTDITGFGLAGHLLEMLDGHLGARVELEALPVLAGAEAAMEQGIFSTLHESNQRLAAMECDNSTARAQLLFDPQTSGGLLMAVPASAAEAALAALKGAGYAAALIGEVLEAPASSSQALQLV